MGSLMVVMLDIFRDGVAQGTFAEEDRAIDALVFYGLNEAFGDD